MEKPSASGQASPADERLDSWKEIASYLKRSVRGVQRWEAEEGMPVHRHRHDKRGTIFAFKPELDTWWRKRGALLAEENGADEAALLSTEREPSVEIETPALPPSVEAPQHAKTSASVPRKSIRAALIGAAFALAGLLVVLVALLSRNDKYPASSTRPLSFKARDWVLVTSFENRTGEPIFDGTLENALTREISNSRHVNVVSPERTGDALRLMRKPLDSRVNAALGREICLRDGEIRALLTGRIERLGSSYLFSIAIVEPKQGTTVGGFVEETTGKDGILSALPRISDRVREILGEEQPPGDRQKSALAKVTTSSLKALQLYSQADLLMRRDDNQAAAEELLKQAVAEDPGFASAYIHLAWAMRNQGRPLEDWRSHAETALRLSENTTERERYFIRGSYYDLLGEKPKAAAAYEALLSLYPDHLWAVGNLWSIYEFPRDLEKIVRVKQRLADLRPNDFGANVGAARELMVWQRDSSRAEPYLSRARALLLSEGYTEETSGWAGWIELLPVAEKWLARRPAEALKELDRVSALIDSTASDDARKMIVCRVGNWYTTLGLLDAAERLYEKIPELNFRNEVLAQVSFFRGDTADLRDRLERRKEREITLYPSWSPTVVLVVRSGVGEPLLSRWLAAAEKTGSRNMDILRGELALAQGKVELGIALLQRGTADQVYTGGFQILQLGLESLAAALETRGETRRAVQVLEQASHTKYLSALSPSGAYWMRNRNRLARLYRKVGRESEARAIEADLLKLLALADDDHPILTSLKARGAAS